MNPSPGWKGRLDALAPFVPLSKCEPLPWDDPLKRLAYYVAKREAREARRMLGEESSRRLDDSS